MLKVLAVCWLSVNIRFYNNVVHCTGELFRVGFSDLILRWYFTSKSTKTKQNKSCESNDEIINLEIYFRAIRLAHIFFLDDIDILRSVSKFPFFKTEESVLIIFMSKLYFSFKMLLYKNFGNKSLQFLPAELFFCVRQIKCL